MSADAILSAALRRARQTRALDTALVALPIVAAAAAASSRLWGIAAALAIALLGLLAVIALATRRARALDTAWLARRLDAARPDMEDSAALLFADASHLSPLQRLQRARLQTRISTTSAPDVRPRLSSTAIALACALALAVIALSVLWPARERLTVANVIAKITPPPAHPTHTRIAAQQLRIAPPGYTGRPVVVQPTLDARVPERSTLQWTLRLAPQPRGAALVFHDGRRVAFVRHGDDWQATAMIERPALYRIELADAPPLQDARAYRIDVIADRAPQVRVIAPASTLTPVARGQRSWSVAFEAQDDYGVDANAKLRVILAQGSGENITFRERAVTLRGTGPAMRRRFAHTLDFAGLGFAEGDDLIVQLLVQDTRTPEPHRVASTSLILRWAVAPAEEATGLDGVVRTVLPAYFRSQRQVIIDAEALLRQKRRLDAARYLQRSDSIGVDQRALRLRYGQFLGEESEGAPSLPTNDADSADEHAHADGDDAAHADTAKSQAAAPPTDTHDHAPAAARKFGQDGDVLEQFGHTHDQSEAATLLDPETRTTLRAALDAMWQSELHLRQGEPDRALPHAYRALGFIKKVQQASRIYLARVGPELPPIDESRRLGGDRTGLARREDALVPAERGEPVLAGLWQALDPASDSKRPIDTAPLDRWLRDNPSRVPDPLAFVAALDAVRADPACARCRRELRALLWPLLPRPATAVPRRTDAGPTGARYLDALRRGATP